MSSQGYLSRLRYSISTPSGRSLAVNAQEPSTVRSLAQMRCHDVVIDPASVNWPIFHIGAAVAHELDAFGARARMAGAVHHEIGAEPADDVAPPRDTLG